jgi:hypothetical protein
MLQSAPELQVFINCPFDPAYKPLFDAIVFAVFDCGFQARSALEVDDGSQVRFEKIVGLIADCQYGIHDISRIELDTKSGLPRFNMPLELGLFLGAKRYGGARQKQKKCLILEAEKFRYQQLMSDISGQDIRAHRNEPETAVGLIRNWLRTAAPDTALPGGATIWRRYKAFRRALPAMCRRLRLTAGDLTFVDYEWLVSEWLKANT